MKCISKIDLNMGEKYLSEWNEILAIREIIANAIDETKDRKIDIFKVENKWIIRNKGDEIKPDNFIIEEGEKRDKQGKIGKFGIGLKDALSVLTNREIIVEIHTSRYKFIPKYRLKSPLIKHKSLFIYVYEEISSFVGTQVILSNCNDKFIKEAQSKFIYYKEGLSIIDRTIYGDVIIEANNENKGCIYLNGVYIGREKTFIYSYNITKSDEKLNNGLSRERKDISREAYSDCIRRIIENISNIEIVDKLYEKFLKSRQGSLSGEIQYQETLVKILKYVEKHNIKIVIFPVERTGKLEELYTNLKAKHEIKIITLLYKHYKKLLDAEELKNYNMIADYYKLNFERVSRTNLSTEEKKYYDIISNFAINKIPKNLVTSVFLLKDNLYYYNKDAKEVFIPIMGLNYVKGCCFKLLDTIDAAIINENVKDAVLIDYINEQIEDSLNN